MTHTVEISNKSKLLRKYKEAEKAARRAVMDGFPITRPFSSPAEVAAYLNGDKITCLLCGRAFGGLAGHLSSVHQVSADDYRERYGLPYRCGLTSAAARETARNAQQALPASIREERAKRMRDPEIVAKRIEASRKQRTSGFKRMQAVERVQAMPEPQRIYSATHAADVIDLMERDGLTLAQAIKQAGTLKFTTFRQIVRADDALRLRYEAIAGAACWEQQFGNKWGAKGRPR